MRRNGVNKWGTKTMSIVALVGAVVTVNQIYQVTGSHEACRKYETDTRTMGRRNERDL